MSVGQPDEAALVAAAKAGDRDALGRVLTAHYDRCFAVCRRILGSHEDALDATQEAMIAIARGMPGFDGRSSFSTWCFRVATNAALDELRRRRRRAVPVCGPLEDDEAPGGLSAGGGDRVAGPVTDRLVVAAALQQLPDDLRVAVVLRDIAGLDYAEIADVLGVPIGTVRSRIFRGRTALAGSVGHEPADGVTVTRSQRNDPRTSSVQGRTP